MPISQKLTIKFCSIRSQIDQLYFSFNLDIYKNISNILLSLFIADCKVNFKEICLKSSAFSNFRFMKLIHIASKQLSH